MRSSTAIPLPRERTCLTISRPARTSFSRRSTTSPTVDCRGFAMNEVRASYRPKDDASALHVDKPFYRKLAESPRQQIDEFDLPPRTGRAWQVRAGQIFRITTIEGPQVADLNLWSAEDPTEHLWSSRTRQLQAAHVTTFDRLWSTLPSLRPMVTIIDDTVPRPPAESGRVHDLLGTRCDPYVTKLLADKDYDRSCHSNLTRAIAEFGLPKPTCMTR